jgi:hypothetical protein
VSYRRELRRLLPWIEDLRGILGEWDCYRCALRSVAGRRLVWTENPSKCATVDCKVCKREITLYCHCISVIYKWERNQLLINPIIRTRTRLISGVHVTILSTHLRLCLLSGLVSSDFPTNILYAFLFSQFVLHATLISPFLTWSF